MGKLMPKSQVDTSLNQDNSLCILSRDHQLRVVILFSRSDSSSMTSMHHPTSKRFRSPTTSVLLAWILEWWSWRLSIIGEDRVLVYIVSGFTVTRNLFLWLVEGKVQYVCLFCILS